MRLELERSSEARALLAELETLRSAARATRFAAEDRQWSEAPRSAASALARRLGLLLLVVWLVLGIAVASWQVLLQPFGLEMTRGMTWWAAGLWLAAGLGGALVFLSILSDRLHDQRSDRYRRVLK